MLTNIELFRSFVVEFSSSYGLANLKLILSICPALTSLTVSVQDISEVGLSSLDLILGPGLAYPNLEIFILRGEYPKSDKIYISLTKFFPRLKLLDILSCHCPLINPEEDFSGLSHTVGYMKYILHGI